MSKKCPTCDGDGTITCKKCDGRGKIGGIAGLGEYDCDRCDGLGEHSCPNCDGTGEVQIMEWVHTIGVVGALHLISFAQVETMIRYFLDRFSFHLNAAKTLLCNRKYSISRGICYTFSELANY